MTHLLLAGVDRRMINDDEEVSSSLKGETYTPITGNNTPITGGSVSGDNSEDEDDLSSVSDCESGVSGSRLVEQASIEVKGLVRLDDGDKLHGMIGKKFIFRLREIGIDAQLQCIHRNMFNASPIGQARISSFQIFAKAVEKRNGGDANIKYAWFGASKDEIKRIIVHGFGYDDIQKNTFFDHGIVLSADRSPLESVESATADEDGIKHILLCRVLLGKSELVNPGSIQSHPSSEDLHSGVDDLVSPKKYYIWSSHMNTHILPEFIISFKTITNINTNPFQENNPGPNRKRPVSPWIPIPDLIAAVSKILPPKDIKKITQFRRSFIEHKISRGDMIQGIRHVTGDRLLMTVLKSYNDQKRFG